MARSLETPFLIFYDNNGLPLNNGRIWFGVANTNAETNPIVVYWDKAGTIPASQPINTLNGFPSRNGIIGKLYINVDSYSYTIRNKNNAIVNGSLEVFSDNFARTGDTGSGAFTFNSTSTFGTANQQYPIKFIHSNVYSNLDPYGSGTVLFDNTGQDNNQPVASFRNKRATGTLGNGALIVCQNIGGTGITTTSDFQCDVELISNNSLVSTWNGKYEVHTTCGRTTGDALHRDGYIAWCPRRSPLSPSGANTGFDEGFYFLPLSTVGLGLFETDGAGFQMSAKYDYGAISRGDIISSFNGARFKAESTLLGGDAYLDLFSGSAGNLTIGGHYRWIASGADNRISLQNMSAGGTKSIEVLQADASNRGITRFLNYLDASKAEIGLGDSTYRHLIKGETDSFDFDSVGVTDLTTSGVYRVQVKQTIRVVPPNFPAAGTTNITASASRVFLYGTLTLALASAQNYTVNLPPTPKNTQEVEVLFLGVTPTFSIKTTDGSLFPNGTNTMAFTPVDNSSVIVEYQDTDNIWLIKKLGT